MRVFGGSLRPFEHGESDLVNYDRNVVVLPCVWAVCQMCGNVCLLLNLLYQRFDALMEWPIHSLTIRESVCSSTCAHQPS